MQLLHHAAYLPLLLYQVRCLDHISCSKCGKERTIKGEVLSGELVLVNEEGCTGSLLSKMHVITTAQCVKVIVACLFCSVF